MCVVEKYLQRCKPDYQLSQNCPGCLSATTAPQGRWSQCNVGAHQDRSSLTKTYARNETKTEDWRRFVHPTCFSRETHQANSFIMSSSSDTLEQSSLDAPLWCCKNIVRFSRVKRVPVVAYIATPFCTWFNTMKEWHYKWLAVQVSVWPKHSYPNLNVWI